MKISRFLSPLLLTILIFYSCAKQTVPTGGPKDTIPPSLVSTFPEKNTVNFSGDRVELTFNEFINLDNPKEQILITPDVGKDYEITAKKKKVEIIFEDPLQDSVTYSINFREAVKDITEKNPAENLKIAFSTGTYIDSLIITGTVSDPLTNKPIKNATVAIYESDTFNIFQHKPSYISRTNELGIFALENLKPGTYSIYAFNDANRNLLVDSKTEGYAFDTARIALTRNRDAGKLNFIRLDSRPIKLTSARPYNTYYNIKFSKYIDEYRLTSSEKDSIASTIGEDKSSIKLYRNFEQDSIPVRLQVTDSLAQKIDTTLYAKFGDRKSTPEPFTVGINSWKITTEKGRLQGIISYNKPISSVNYDSIYFQRDSATVIRFTSQDFKWNPKTQKIIVEKTIDKKLFQEPAPIPSESPSPNQPNPSGRRSLPAPKHSLNQLYIGQAAFISIESDSSQRITESLRPLDLEDTGIIRINIQTDQPNYVVELLDKTFKVVQRIKNTSAISFEDLSPGDYQIRLIIDSDNNGQWSPGNILQKQGTEKIKYYQNEKNITIINLKANWELGPLLISY